MLNACPTLLVADINSILISKKAAVRKSVGLVMHALFSLSSGHMIKGVLSKTENSVIYFKPV